MLLGVLLLWVFGGRLSDKIVEVSERTGLPKAVIAAFIVSLSTTVPEITTSALASYRGAGSIAIGDAVGSIITNVFLILGFASLVRPLHVEDVDEVKRTGMMAVGGIVLLYVLSRGGVLTRLDAVVLLGVYVVYSLWVARNYGGGESSSGGVGVIDFLVIVVYGLFMVAGAHFVVSAGVEVARSLGVPEAVVGLTVVAVGTSLPEFTNTVFSAVRGRGDIGIGNIFGANLMNALVVTGVSAAVRSVSTGVGALSFAVAAAGMLASLGVVLRFRRFPRWVGAVFLVVYVCYVLVIYLFHFVG